jgi:hypothetical protein
MIAIVGAGTGKIVEVFKKYGIGRMFVDKKFLPYKNEPWGFDNGAFKDYLRGKTFDKDRYLKKLEVAISIAGKTHKPYLAVLPDIVGGGMHSLELSIYFLETELAKVDFNWYLAVQDGMTTEAVEEVLKAYPQIRGIFLGGTDEFKKTASVWSSLAHKWGKKFHYARAGSYKKVMLAREAGADSIDSTGPLWTKEKFKRFLKALNHPLQGKLFS